MSWLTGKDIRAQGSFEYEFEMQECVREAFDHDLSTVLYDYLYFDILSWKEDLSDVEISGGIFA